MARKHIIIQLGFGEQSTCAANALAAKHATTYPVSMTEIIKLNPAGFALDEALKHSLDHADCKITLIGHGGGLKDESCLFDDDGNGYFVVYLAHLISELIERSKLATADNPLKLSLVSCYGAIKGPDATASFAEHLHEQLYANGCYSDITARKSTVAVLPSGRKVTASASVSERYASLLMRSETRHKPSAEEKSCTSATIRSLDDMFSEAYVRGTKVKISNASSEDGYRRTVTPIVQPSHNDVIKHSCHLLRRTWFMHSAATHPSRAERNTFDVLLISLQHSRATTYAGAADVVKQQLASAKAGRGLFARLTRLVSSDLYDRLSDTADKIASLSNTEPAASPRTPTSPR